MFGRKCGHEGRAPWGIVRCTKIPNHGGQHGARGLTWGNDGKVKVRTGKARRR